MGRGLRMLAAVLALLSWPGAPAALAQKSGGVLRFSHFDNPASMSILEEATDAVDRPMMGVFNNLVLFDQHVAQNSLELDRARSRRRAGRGATTATS